jgi:hypothetical protein
MLKLNGSVGVLSVCSLKQNIYITFSSFSVWWRVDTDVSVKHIGPTLDFKTD